MSWDHFRNFFAPKNALLSWANSPKLNSSNARCHPLCGTFNGVASCFPGRSMISRAMIQPLKFWKGSVNLILHSSRGMLLHIHHGIKVSPCQQTQIAIGKSGVSLMQRTSAPMIWVVQRPAFPHQHTNSGRPGLSICQHNKYCVTKSAKCC